MKYDHFVYHTGLDKFNTRGKCWKSILKKLIEGTADGVIDPLSCLLF